MLHIQIQMWPHGDKSKAYSLGTMTVALDPATKVSDRLRNYSWRITKKGDRSTWKSGRIEGHNPRTRGQWDLLYRILKLVVGARNP